MQDLLAADRPPSVRNNVDVHESFARDWLGDGGVRVNFIASVDGAISVAGVSRGLQTPGDNQIFAALRDLADVVLVGAGTIRVEGYSPMHLSAERIERRRSYGFAAELPLAMISRRLDLDPDAKVFTDAPAKARTIVLTCLAGDAAIRKRLEPVADVVICGDESVDLDRATAALRERGHTRILCEGGPTLYATLAERDLADELCLTISPLLVGPGAGRITDGAVWGSTRSLRLAGLLEEDGALFCRYVRA
jgi:riboflavin biosynthesis pyrimidine reductase